jgi:dTDP-glucose 4,6-dehydratase
MMNPLSADLDHILNHLREPLNELRGERIFLTGGTGFFGCWLLESLLWANQKLNLGVQAAVLTRNPDAFIKKVPHLALDENVTLLRGDVCDFAFPDGEYGYVIHAATEASAQLNQNDPSRMFDTIVEGTRRTVNFASTHGTKKFLLTSSGAVYGKQPPELSHIPEDYAGAPDPLTPLSAYGEGKRAAELLCTMAAQNCGVEMKIARCFAFVGPYLPLDIHFAIGNFIRDALAGGPIVIKGDGTACRSYLYAADLVIWLWTILLQGKNCRAYNVGSDKVVTIAELAQLIAKDNPVDLEVKIQKRSLPGVLPERYIPSIERAKTELKLSEYIELKTAIQNTEKWFA